jgi:NAD(P)-dependent dehydrogenase (short-subunit alcohol dehydrogenase family)
VQGAVARAIKEFGRLDIIYNNAGLGGAVGPIENITLENWDRSLAVLLRAVFLGIKYSVPEMRKVGGGSIISTASVAGLRGGPGLHAYCAAKAGVVNLTRSAALELGKDKIRVNCICPGGINTPLVYNSIPGGEQVSAQFLAHFQPIARAGRPDDIAGMALYLASDDAEWVSGAAMVVDGGLTAGWGSTPGGGGAAQGVGLGPRDGWSGPSFER